MAVIDTGIGRNKNSTRKGPSMETDEEETFEVILRETGIADDVMSRANVRGLAHRTLDSTLRLNRNETPTMGLK